MQTCCRKFWVTCISKDSAFLFCLYIQAHPQNTKSLEAKSLPEILLPKSKTFSSVLSQSKNKKIPLHKIFLATGMKKHTVKNG